ncbi:MAG: T9SS type A sorting domain-containing protein [Bacteroidetes bacterium]|nr:MAG: T9SS type A sorting domain-containing protein [Bacteroidota bacterium]
MKKNYWLSLAAAFLMIAGVKAQNITYVTFPSGLDVNTNYGGFFNSDNSRGDSMMVQKFSYADFAALDGEVSINSIKGRYFLPTAQPNDGKVGKLDLVIYTSNSFGQPENEIFTTTIEVNSVDEGGGSITKDITTPVTGVTVTSDFFVGWRRNASSAEVVATFVGTTGCGCDNTWIYGISAFGANDASWRTLVSRHASFDLNMYMELNVSKVVANVAPTAVDDTDATDQDTPVTTNVLANDSDSDGNLVPSTVQVTAQPSNGTTSVDAVTGAITYTPSAGFTGTDTYTYRVCDDGTPQECAEATVTITVNAVQTNNAPVANDDDGGELVDGNSGSVSILANDTDADETVTASSHTVDIDLATAGIQTTYADVNGTWSYNASLGILTCTPATDYFGVLTLDYQLCDSDNACDTATVTFNSVVGLEEISLITKIYPNPVKDQIHVELANSSLVSAKVLTLEGKQVAALEVNGGNTLTVPSMTAGMYLLEVKLQDGSVSRTSFVKE